MFGAILLRYVILSASNPEAEWSDGFHPDPDRTYPPILVYNEQKREPESICIRRMPCAIYSIPTTLASDRCIGKDKINIAVSSVTMSLHDPPRRFLLYRISVKLFLISV